MYGASSARKYQNPIDACQDIIRATHEELFGNALRIITTTAIAKVMSLNVVKSRLSGILHNADIDNYKLMNEFLSIELDSGITLSEFLNDRILTSVFDAIYKSTEKNTALDTSIVSPPHLVQLATESLDSLITQEAIEEAVENKEALQFFLDGLVEQEKKDTEEMMGGSQVSGGQWTCRAFCSQKSNADMAII